jgi:hypothetical protein
MCTPNIIAIIKSFLIGIIPTLFLIIFYIIQKKKGENIKTLHLIILSIFCIIFFLVIISFNFNKFC